MITVVEGSASDISAVMSVMDNAFDQRFGEAWTAAQCLSTLVLPDCRLLLAKSGANVAGFAISRWMLDHEELLMIGVARNFQGQNVGKALLLDIISRARNAGRTKIFLEVRDGNNAHDFYENSGFIPIGRRKNYYKSAEGISPDAITMNLVLE
jgi:ribosomal-protein-alanine N-acetyltransferase